MTEEAKKEKWRISQKAYMIYGLKVIIDVLKEQDKGIKLRPTLLTPYGFIIGDLEKIAETSEEFLSTVQNFPNSSRSLHIDISYLVKMTNQQLEKLSEDKEREWIVTDYAPVLYLRNAEVYKDNLVTPVATIEQLLLFADQVIGFTIGSRDVAE